MAPTLRSKRVWQIYAVAAAFAVVVAMAACFGSSEAVGMQRKLLSDDAENEELSNYPTDIFTKQQRESGAIILHILGVMYMFAALAIICDEFFVPSLDVICEKLKLEDNVAGATFMAAGGSAPELATSFIGTFVSKSNVGFGTIVGSAVFNILFVIGTCALVSPSNINLSWWPLARDSLFYTLSLGVLIAVFADRKVYHWEAAVLFCVYIVYVSFMRYNEQAEAWVRRMLGFKAENEPEGKEQKMEMGEIKQATESNDNVVLDEHKEDHEDGKQKKTKITFGMHTLFSSQRKMEPKSFKAKKRWKVARIKLMSRIRKKKSMSDIVFMAMAKPDKVKDDEGNQLAPADSNPPELDGDQDDDDGPMDLEWPSTLSKQISYLILAPLTFFLYYTIPDVRREGWKGYYALTFFLSIASIGFFSYFMVWWVTLVGDTIGIPSQVMGLTVLAIGTSVPDLLESVIVAKQGKGDMAISSSIGSNIFDVTIGLPIPWLLFTLINGPSLEVGTDGLFISVVLLFGMLISCVVTIAVSGWTMSKQLGAAFFVLWIIFVTISLIVEFLA